MAGEIAGKEKTHDRRQPWVLVEIALCATSHGGIINDDHQDRNLQRSQNHQWQANRVCPGGSSLESGALRHAVWRKSDFGNGYASRQPWRRSDHTVTPPSPMNPPLGERVAGGRVRGPLGVQGSRCDQTSRRPPLDWGESALQLVTRPLRLRNPPHPPFGHPESFRCARV